MTIHTRMIISFGFAFLVLFLCLSKAREKPFEEIKKIKTKNVRYEHNRLIFSA